MSRPLTVSAVLFDFYNTLVRIVTDEDQPTVWKQLARFLGENGLAVDPARLRRWYAAKARAQQSQGSVTEQYPETDVLGIFAEIVNSLAGEPRAELVEPLAMRFRKASMKEFHLFPETVHALEKLSRREFPLGLVTDAQPLFVRDELARVGLSSYFRAIVISVEDGFHKPDTRLFAQALEKLDVRAGEAVFVGDNVSRDIYGAKRAGLSAILVDRDSNYRRAKTRCEPDFVITDLAELDGLLA